MHTGRTRRTVVLAAALLGTVVGAARAQSPAAQPAVPDWVSRVTLGGVAYLNWRYEATQGAGGFNAFDVARLYLTTVARPMPHVRLRVTLDAPNREATVATRAGGDTTTVKAGGAKFDVILKHAYAEWYDVLTPGLAVRFGMADLPWVPVEDRLWSFRYQGPVFADREGYLSSTDLGVSALYATRNRMVEGHVALVNGEGWTGPEASRNKDLHAQLTVRPLIALAAPLRGFSVSAFGSTGASDTLAKRTRQRFIARVAYEHRYAFAAAEFLRAADAPATLVSRQPSLAGSTDAEVVAQGWSAFGWLDLGLLGTWPGVRVMGRVEHLDPDTHLASNGHTRAIVGVAYAASDLVQVLLDWEFVNYEAHAGVAHNERRLFVHAAVGF